MNRGKFVNKTNEHVGNKMWRAQAHRLEGKVRNIGIKPKKKAKKRIAIFDPFAPVPEEDFRYID